MAKKRSSRKPPVAAEAPAGVAVDRRGTKLAQQRWDRGAPTYDLFTALMERFLEGRWRRRQWSKVGPGRLLEVGVGTGRNIPYYTDGAAVVALDFSPKMLRQAVRKLPKRGPEVSLALMDAQSLALASNAFDGGVSSFVFCSVPDPVRGLAEMRRVVRPGGRVILLEHVRSSNRILGWLMDVVNPLVVRFIGANINRDTVANVKAAGFEVTDVASFMGGIVKLIEARKGG